MTSIVQTKKATKIVGVIVPLKECDISQKHSITIHTLGIDTMYTFIEFLNWALEETGNERIDVPDNKIVSRNLSTKDLLKDLDWFDMPEYKFNSLLENKFSLTLYFPKKMTDDFKEQLESLIGAIKPTTKTAYYGDKDEGLFVEKNVCWKETETISPKYPIYIISKGRWQNPMTANFLKSIRVTFKIVVEPQEYDEYVKKFNPANILVLPKEYLGLNQGGIPARNFVLHHSRANGDKRHWILDDNIRAYYRYNDSHRYKMKSGACFRIVEDYVDRYENIYLAGHNYRMFAVTTNLKLKAITTNTRIYSSILIQNDIKHEWRGRYNEDTDLSLRVLKDGGRTLLFNCVLADKQTTGKMKGGNTSGIYAVKDAMFLKADSLRQQHPDVCKVAERFGRPHHIVNYLSFANNKAKLLVPLPTEFKKNEYSLVLLGESLLK